jgi:5-methylcytosine-specific restriction protein A
MSEPTGPVLNATAMVAALRPGGPPDKPVRHQAILLLWAIGRAARNEKRLVTWKTARPELIDLLSRFGHPDNRPTPEYPFVALARTEWWDLAGARTAPPAAHSSRTLTWLTTHNPQGGLTLSLRLRILEDTAGRDRIVRALLNRFFSGEQPDELLTAVGLPVPVQPTAQLAWTWDELVLACSLLARNAWHELPATDSRVVELSHFLKLLPIHPLDLRGPRFRNANSVRRKMADIATQHPDSRRQKTNGNKLDKQVLDAFLVNEERMHLYAAELRRSVLAGELLDLPPETETDDGAQEGGLLERRSRVRERDPALRAQKILDARTKRGHIACEVCSFDFERVYGDRGAGYVECHHAVPLHVSGPTTTYLDDLILLCANCHRMIHRFKPWLTPDELRTMVEARIG